MAVVVTRYFGGIKLGAGGLIRCIFTLRCGNIYVLPLKNYTTRTQLQATIDYSLYGAVERFPGQDKTTL